MSNESVKIVQQLTDIDFLSYARLFGRGDMLLKDYIELRDYVKKRCNDLGYIWEHGCCGTHNLVPISYAKKN